MGNKGNLWVNNFLWILNMVGGIKQERALPSFQKFFVLKPARVGELVKHTGDVNSNRHQIILKRVGTKHHSGPLTLLVREAQNHKCDVSSTESHDLITEQRRSRSHLPGGKPPGIVQRPQVSKTGRSPNVSHSNAWHFGVPEKQILKSEQECTQLLWQVQGTLVTQWRSRNGRGRGDSREKRE